MRTRAHAARADATLDVPVREKRGLLQHSLIYGLVPLVRYATSIGMTRFYTGCLISAFYGVKEIFDLWIILLQQLLGTNLLAGMVRIYFDRPTAEERARVVTSTTLFVTVAAWCVCGPALFFAGDLAGVLIGRPTSEVSAHEISTAMALVLLLIPFQLSTLSGLHYLQILERSKAYSAIQTAKLAFEISLHLYFMGYLGLGLRGFLLGLVVGEAVTSLVVLGWMLRELPARFSWSALRPVLAYAAPLVPVGVFQLLLHQLDRRLIEFSFSGDGGLALVGIYGLGYKIGYLVNAVMLGPFLQIWQPWAFGLRDPRERAAQVARVTTRALMPIAAATLVVIVFARELVSVLAGRPEYLEAYRIVPWIASGYLFWALYNAAQVPLFIAKRTPRILAINFAALVANLGLNLWLVPRFDIHGAAVATCATFALLAALGLVASRSEGRVPFELARLARILLVVGVVATVTMALDRELGPPFDPLGLGTRVMLAAGSVATLWHWILREDEREQMQRWLAARVATLRASGR